MSEHNFWGRVRDGLNGLKEVGHLIDLVRVENMVGPGTPDVNYCANNNRRGLVREGWIELKHVGELPKRDGTPVFGAGGLRDEQIVWISQRVRRGGRVYILAQMAEGIALLKGYHARNFNDMCLSEIGENACWLHAGDSPDWQELFDVLTEERF